MMRIAVLISVALVALACDGKLTDEQRKKMREQMELHKIKRVTEPEITEAAFKAGRSIMAQVERIKSDSAKIDSLVRANEGRVRWIMPGSENAVSLERQLVDAYLANDVVGAADNVQQVRNGQNRSDSILYTKPVVTTLPDGTERLEGVWNIWLSKKQIILSMDK